MNILVTLAAVGILVVTLSSVAAGVFEARPFGHHVHLPHRHGRRH